MACLTTAQVQALTTEADQQPDHRQPQPLGTAQFAALNSDQAAALTTAQVSKPETADLRSITTGAPLA